MSPEVKLWRAVIINAVKDAQTNKKSDLQDAAWHARWADTAKFREVCSCANLDPDTIRDGFKNIAEGKTERYFGLKGRTGGQ